MATVQADDAREINLSVPVSNPEMRFFLAYQIKHFDAPQIIPQGATLEYEIKFPPDAKWCIGSFDMESSPRLFKLRDYNTHPTNAIPEARGKWFTRRVSLERCSGRPFQTLFLSAEFDPNGKGIYTVSYRRMRIVDASGKVYWNFVPQAGELTDPAGDLPGGTSIQMQEQAFVTIMPSKFVFRDHEGVAIEASVKNIDPSSRVTLTVQSQLVPENGEAKPLKAVELSLAAGEVKKIEFPTQHLRVGNYSVKTQVKIGKSEGILRTPSFSVSNLPHSIPSFEAIKDHKAMIWGADVTGYPPLRHLALVREKGGNYINLFINWATLEPQEGEYDFSVLDAMLANADKANLKVEIFLANYISTDYPAWTKDEWMVDQTGKSLNINRMESALSFWARKARPAYMKLLRTMVARYKNDPRVIGYQPSFGGWGDSFYHTARDGSLRIYDYSEFSQEMFRTYIKEVLGLSLKEASQRYGLKLASWSELRQPEPSEELNLSPIWWDFQNYRCWTVEKMWEEVCSVIRSVDKKCLIDLCYGGGQNMTGKQGNDYDVACAIARKYRVSIHNTCYEGNDNAQLLGSYSQRWNIIHSAELAGTPAVYPNHQQGMFNVLKFSPNGYCWISGRCLDGIYPSYPLLRPVATELSGSLPMGKKLGLLQSISFHQTCMRERNFKYQKIHGGSLAEKLGLPVDMLTDRAFLMDDNLSYDSKTTPVLILYGEPVLTEAAMCAVIKYAKNGGNILLFPQSGKHCAGKPDSEYEFIRKLGFSTPESIPLPKGSGMAKGTGSLSNAELKLGEITPLTTFPKAEALATFGDGSPAIIKWKFGKGQILMIGGSPDLTDKRTRDFFASLLEYLGLKSPLFADHEVITALKKKDDVVYAILFNQSKEARETTVSCQGIEGKKIRVTNLLNRYEFPVITPEDLARGIKVHLEPYEVTALAIEEASKAPRSAVERDYPLETF